MTIQPLIRQCYQTIHIDIASIETVTAFKFILAAMYAPIVDRFLLFGMLVVIGEFVKVAIENGTKTMTIMLKRSAR